MTTTEGRSTSLRTLAVLCVVASAVEWYDFFLYAAASATVLGSQFFTPLGDLGGRLVALTTFGLAFLARPLGGVLFGILGDRSGRRTALAVATATMGAATALIGLIPPYATLGVAAPVLLVVLRLVQGLALGGQWAGSVLLLTEQAPAHRRGLYGSIAQLGSPIGGVVATGFFAVMAATLSPADFSAWGWRVPFVISTLFIGLAMLVQRRIEDSPAFRALPRTRGPSRLPVVEVLREQPREILRAAGTFVAASASLYVFITFLLTYLPSPAIGLPRSTVLLLTTVTQLFQIPGILVGATVSDRIGRRRVYLVGAIALAVWAFPAFLLIDTGAVAAVAVALAVAHLVLGAMYGPLAALFTEMFATRVRYSGASLGYQLGTVLGGGLAPIVATLLFAATGSSASVAAYLVVVALITVGAASTLRERSGETIAPTIPSTDGEPVEPRPDP